MCKIIILQGVPASGKSTWAKEFVKNKSNWVIVCRDSIRDATGEYWVPSRENYISDVEEFEIRSAIKHNLNVIVDATNLNPKTIEKWNNIAKDTNSIIEFKTFEIDFKTALERDLQRNRPVGKKVLESFFKKYFPKKLEEYYTDNRKQAIRNPQKEDCIICDLDGTLCLHQGRSPYDLSKVSEDKPNDTLLTLLISLNKNYPIIFVSGREGTKQCYNDTYNWIEKYFDAQKIKDSKSWKLFMRWPNDYRHDEIIKEEIYHNEIEPNYNVISVFDDRDRVVKMWRELGLLCNQVYYGNF